MKCLLCQHACQLFNQNPFGHFWSCPHCRAICRDPKEFLSQQAERHRYLLHQNALDNPGYQQYFVSIIDQAISPFFSLGRDSLGLDYGSGPQPVLAQVMDKYYQQKVVNFDPYFATDTSLLKDQAYQLISCIEVAEHFHLPASEFRQLHRLLSPKGILLCLCTHFAPQERKDFEQWWYMHDPSHVIFYALPTFTYIAKQFGFKILATDSKSWITLKKIA